MVGVPEFLELFPKLRQEARWLRTSAATSGYSPPTMKATRFGWISAHLI
jgi:hypothetical protein